MEEGNRPQDGGTAALEGVDHIVVLMMENRSFDHMLGYLSLNGRSDVDGLRPDFVNRYKGRTYPIHPLDRTRLEHWEDPDHSGDGVAEQLKGENGGFVRNYVESRPRQYRGAIEREERVLPMGYYDHSTLYAFDHLAKQYCVCDRWFSSVPGATWPNRLYAMCGQSGGASDNKKLFGLIDWPLYYLPSVARHLDAHEVDWRWYHARPADLEPPTLQVADARYMFRPGEHFALFEAEEAASGQASFIDDAENGNLPPVAWIDPDFGITKRHEANDDHPPTDVRNGQRLVSRVANAVMTGRAWERTLLLITYDEHGGFFDHVPPPGAADDRPEMRRYGVRVPALVVSPLVEPGQVSSIVFDHTSILKTILARFCRRSDGSLPWMGARVAAAQHLGQVLSDSESRPAAPVPDDDAEGSTGSRPIESDEQRWLAMPRPASLATDEVLHEAGGPPPANDVQLGLLRAGLERQDGPEFGLGPLGPRT